MKILIRLALVLLVFQTVSTSANAAEQVNSVMIRLTDTVKPIAILGPDWAAVLMMAGMPEGARYMADAQLELYRLEGHTKRLVGTLPIRVGFDASFGALNFTVSKDSVLSVANIVNKSLSSVLGTYSGVGVSAAFVGGAQAKFFWNNESSVFVRTVSANAGFAFTPTTDGMIIRAVDKTTDTWNTVVSPN